MKNNSIKCEVTKCKHNDQISNCMLECIKVTCGQYGSCTCCGDYDEKD